MNTAVTSFMLGDPAAILDRHAIRRTTGVPTVSLLVGPIGAGVGTWRRWAAGRDGASLSQTGTCSRMPNGFAPSPNESICRPRRSIAWPERAERDPNELLAAWRAKTPADCERFWNSLAPNADDDLLQGVASLAVGRAHRVPWRHRLSDLGERIVPVIARLAPSANWPSVLFVAGSADDFLSVGRVAVKWAMRVPALPIAVAVTGRSVGRIRRTGDRVAHQSTAEGRRARGSGH